MTATLFERRNADYSQKIHILARKSIYPKLFGVPENALRYEENTLVGQSEMGDMLDGEMGIDRIVNVSAVKGDLKAPLSFTVQERFRRPEYASFRDITITEWNHASNLPSELYKIRAGIYLYGYADSENNPRFIREYIAVDTLALLMAIANGAIEYEERFNKKRQSFLCITFQNLYANPDLHLVKFHRLNRDLADPEHAAAYFAESKSSEWFATFSQCVQRRAQS